MKWLFLESNVERQCTRLVQKHGPDAANIILKLCKQLDSGEAIELETIEDREFRKRIRHLFEAFCLTPTKQTVVPGIAPVAKGFKKPSECEIRLAKVVKPFLVKAIELYLEKQIITKPAKSPKDEPVAQEVEISQDRLDFQRGIMEALSLGDQGNEQEGNQGEECDVDEGENLNAGIMSLEEYKELKERGEDVAPIYTRGFSDTAEQKSLMDLRKEGTYKGHAAEVLKYETLRQQQGELWGKSQREQHRHMAKRRKIQDGNAEEEDDDQEPWTRFDREKVFAGTRKGITKAQFNDILELTAENAANFKKAQ